MNVIATQTNSGVAITRPVGKMLDLEAKAVRDVTTDDILKRFNTPGSPMLGATSVVIDHALLPDPYFRNAWVFHPQRGAVIDVERAKDFQRNVWRQRRAKLMADLDVQFQRATERGNAEQIAAVVDKKQALRDVTTSPLPDDPDGIKSTVPAILVA